MTHRIIISLVWIGLALEMIGCSPKLSDISGADDSSLAPTQPMPPSTAEMTATQSIPGADHPPSSAVTVIQNVELSAKVGRLALTGEEFACDSESHPLEVRGVVYNDVAQSQGTELTLVVGQGLCTQLNRQLEALVRAENTPLENYSPRLTLHLETVSADRAIVRGYGEYHGGNPSAEGTFVYFAIPGTDGLQIQATSSMYTRRLNRMECSTDGVSASRAIIRDVELERSFNVSDSLCQALHQVREHSDGEGYIFNPRSGLFVIPEIIEMYVTGPISDPASRVMGWRDHLDQVHLEF